MTSPCITIEETIPLHLRMMADAMTPDCREVAKCMGLTPLKALWGSYRNSIICKTAFIDGNIAAIWGLSGIILSEAGKPWLILSSEAQEYPFRVAFRYRKELKDMLKLFPVLEDYVPEDNEKSIRLLELMGFKISKNRIPFGKTMLRRAERRA